jgi:uncharacterized membrane protein YdjX (TVP38/TMEM64 family)
MQANTTRAALRPKVLVLTLLLAAATLVLVSEAPHDALTHLLALTEQAIAANPAAGAGLFVLFAALSGVLAFFSSAVLVPIAVSAWGVPTSAALLWLGWLLGGASTYALGRWLGRPVAGLVAPHQLARYERKITREAPFGLIVLFQLSTPSEVPGYLLGMMRYSFLRYIVVVALGELPYAVGTVFLGDSFVKRQVLPFVILGALALIVTTWAYSRLHRRLDAQLGERGEVHGLHDAAKDTRRLA